jgi:hypothetical protein
MNAPILHPAETRVNGVRTNTGPDELRGPFQRCQKSMTGGGVMSAAGSR